RQEALAMHRAGESIKGMTAAGFDMMLRTSATEHLPNALAQSGDIMLARGRPATALQFYQSAMDAGATDPTLQVKAQATLQTVRRVRQGESSLPPEKAEGFDRGETLRIARLQRVNEDFPAALDRLKAILARDPGDESALTELVKLHLSLGDFGNAKETLRRSLDVLPNSVELLTAAAEAELLAGNSTQAMGYLDKACLAWVRARKTMTEATQAPRPLLCWNEAIDELDNAKVAAL
ncbi:MAG: tetratricopeptide repeat protein, partial [Acidobacteriota bacterium]